MSPVMPAVMLMTMIVAHATARRQLFVEVCNKVAAKPVLLSEATAIAMVEAMASARLKDSLASCVVALLLLLLSSCMWAAKAQVTVSAKRRVCVGANVSMMFFFFFFLSGQLQMRRAHTHDTNMI